MTGRYFAGAALALAATQAIAADPPAAPSGADRVVRSFTACRAIDAAEARLACFDRAAGALETAVAKKEVTILDRADVRKTRRSLFGFTLPRFSIFGGDDSDAQDEAERQEFTQIDTTIKAVSGGPNGRAVVTLEDDAVWTTVDPVAWMPKPGSKIRIRKGVMGVYFLAFEGRSYRGLRMR